MTSAVWDPLSRNPYRLLGVTVEGDVDWSDIRPQPIFQAPGLETIEQTPELLSDALAALAVDEHLPFYRATWFDASRPLDQVAYADVCRGRLQEAWQRWLKDPEPTSLHNLAILAHLRWLFQGGDLPAQRECAQRWRQLYDRTRAPGYAAVLTGFVEWCHQLGYQQLTQGSAEGVQRSFQLLGWLGGAEEVARFEGELLKDDREKAALALASLRQAILEEGAIGEVTSRFESEALPVVNFVLAATLPDTPIYHEIKRDLCLFYRLLARSWHRQGSQHSRQYGEAWMDQALRVSPPDLAEEIRSELEHWKATRQPVSARAFSQSSPDPERQSRLRAGLVLVLLLLGLGAWMVWKGRRPEPLPWGHNLTRPAVQKRIEEILHEISPLAARLGELNREIAETQNATRKQQLQTEQRELKARHEKLKSELIRLQKWLEAHS